MLLLQLLELAEGKPEHTDHDSQQYEERQAPSTRLISKVRQKAVGEEVRAGEAWEV